MITTTMRRFNISFLLGLSTSILLASVSTGAIRMRVVCLDKIHQESEIYVMGSGSKEILKATMDHYTPTPLMKVSSSGKIRLFSTAPVEGEPLPPVLFEKNIPTGMTSALLVLVPKSTKPVKYSGIWLKDSPNDFHGGGRCFVNLTKTELRAAIGDQKKLIPPGKIHVFNLTKPANKEGVMRVMVDWRIDKTKPWSRLMRRNWTFERRVREVVFFYWDDSKRKVKHRALSERVDLLKTDIEKFKKNEAAQSGSSNHKES